MKDDREYHEQNHLSARRMRLNPTSAEHALWQGLRDRKLGGLKFRRQWVIGSFIADFYCAAARLVIEVDGDIHDYQKEVDSTRSRQFEDYGYKVIRFDNEMVLNQLDEVLTEIGLVAMERISAVTGGPLTPNPSPNPGRGEQEHGMEISPDPGRGEQDWDPKLFPNPGDGETLFSHLSWRRGPGDEVFLLINVII